MDGSFLVKLALTFVVGGLWVMVSTAVADRAGAKIGGWFGGLPSTVAVALFFIGLVQGLDAAAEATTMIPLVAGVNGLFLVVYILGSRRKFSHGFGPALLAWSAFATMAILMRETGLAVSLAGFAVFFTASHLLLPKDRSFTPLPGRAPVLAPAALAGRALLSGFIIASAVALAKAAGPTIGGVFAAFPGVFTSTIVITYRSRGLDFSRAIARPLMTSGLVNVAVYAVAVRIAYPAAGLAAGTAIAYAATLVAAFFVYLVISRSS
jgi:hypothetical protein